MLSGAQPTSPARLGMSQRRGALYCASPTGNYAMTAEVSHRFASADAQDLDAQDLAGRRLAIGFINWAHALDHFVILIYPTVVIELAGDLRPLLCVS